MTKPKVKFVDIGKYAKCYRCEGSGEEDKKECSTCRGFGKFKRTNYHLICEDDNGNRIAFQVDTIK